jgi:hypothetical protein
MASELRHYLSDIRVGLRLEPSTEREVICELYTHLEEQAQELKEAGLSEDEAAKAAAKHFGAAKVIAGEINQVHSSGTWGQAIVAALPHVFLALLFIFHQCHNIGWLLAVFSSIFGIAIYGWQRSKPSWVFSWLGYALIPLLAVGIILFVLWGQALSLFPKSSLESSWWVWLATFAYIPLALWLFVSVTLQAVKRDWLLGSLMALPLPALTGWFLEVQREDTFLEDSKQRLLSLEPWIALSFFSLAAVVILFIRSRHRSLKGGALLTAGVTTLILVAYSSRNCLNLFNLGVLALVTLLILLGPALLEHKVGHESQEARDWDYIWLKEPFLKHR